MKKVKDVDDVIIGQDAKDVIVDVMIVNVFQKDTATPVIELIHNVFVERKELKIFYTT